jgi:hypothetical protein
MLAAVQPPLQVRGSQIVSPYPRREGLTMSRILLKLALLWQLAGLLI